MVIQNGSPTMAKAGELMQRQIKAMSEKLNLEMQPRSRSAEQSSEICKTARGSFQEKVYQVLGLHPTS